MNKKLGWILPDGRFIECGFRQHSQCASDIIKIDEEKLEKIAIKITRCDITYNIFFLTGRRQYTSKQLRTIRAYCIEQKVKPPHKYFTQTNLEDLEHMSLDEILRFL